MAGRPRGSEPRTHTIRVRLTASGKEIALRAAGGLSLSDYVRSLIAQDVERRGIGK